MPESESEHFSPYRSDGKLYGFVCIVTGATQPVGKAIVLELAAHGVACVYACSASPSDDFHAVIDEVSSQHPSTKVMPYATNSADEEATLTLIDDVLNAWGRLDVYITTTPSPGPSSLATTTPSTLSHTFQTHSLAPFLALKYAPPAMAKTTPKGQYRNAAPKDRAYGSIIVVTNVASTSGGFLGPADTIGAHAALGVVKAGVKALKGTGVRINCVSAGWVEEGRVVGEESLLREKVGLERAGLPMEVARVAGFLASGFSTYLTGSNVVVDGGATAMSPVMFAD